MSKTKKVKEVFRSLLDKENERPPLKEIYNGFEIEKRFVLFTHKEDYTKQKNGLILYDEVLKDGKRYAQGYITDMPTAIEMVSSLGIKPAFQPNTIRLRMIDDKTFILTLKDKKETKRREVEWELDKKTFMNLWKLTKGHRVYKRRLEKNIKGHNVEIDAFTDRLLLIAEIEVKEEKDLDNLPKLGFDVTKDSSWSNKAMAK